MNTVLKVITGTYKKVDDTESLIGRYRAESLDSSALPPKIKIIHRGGTCEDEHNVAKMYDLMGKRLSGIDVFEDVHNRNVLYGHIYNSSDIIILIHCKNERNLKVVVIKDAMIENFYPRYIASFISTLKIFIRPMNILSRKHDYRIFVCRNTNGDLVALKRMGGTCHVK